MSFSDGKSKAKSNIDKYRRYCIFEHDPQKFCYHWNCQRAECRNAKLEIERLRLRKGVEKIAEEGTIWFLTLYFSNSALQSEWFDPSFFEFQKSTTKLLTTLRKLARQQNVQFNYERVNGIKSDKANSPFKLHAHIITSWLPETEPLPTRKRPFRHTCKAVEKAASKLGMTVWIEKGQNPYKIANYCAKNLEQLMTVRVPRGFNRYSCSRNWFKLEYQNNRQAKKNKMHKL